MGSKRCGNCRCDPEHDFEVANAKEFGAPNMT